MAKTDKQVQTKTKTGVPVDLEAVRGEIKATAHHPKHGEVSGFGQWGVIDGREGMVLPDARIGKKWVRICMEIPKSDYATIEHVAAEQKAAIQEEEKRIEEERRQAAQDECPDGYVLARCNWKNGDLMSGEYVTEDGTKVLGSDLLESHHGWYFLPQSTVNQAKAKQAEKIAKKQAEAERRAEKQAEAEKRTKALYRNISSVSKGPVKAEGSGESRVTSQRIDVVHKNGKQFAFWVRNIFDFGRVVNPEQGGIPINIEEFIRNNPYSFDTEEKKAEFRAQAESETGWVWSRGVGDEQRFEPIVHDELECYLVAEHASTVSKAIVMEYDDDPDDGPRM